MNQNVVFKRMSCWFELTILNWGVQNKIKKKKKLIEPENWSMESLDIYSSFGTLSKLV